MYISCVRVCVCVCCVIVTVIAATLLAKQIIANIAEDARKATDHDATPAFLCKLELLAVGFLTAGLFDSY